MRINGDTSYNTGVKPGPEVYLSIELSDFLRALGPEHKFNRWMADVRVVLKGNMLA